MMFNIGDNVRLLCKGDREFTVVWVGCDNLVVVDEYGIEMFVRKVNVKGRR